MTNDHILLAKFGLVQEKETNTENKYFINK